MGESVPRRWDAPGLIRLRAADLSIETTETAGQGSETNVAEARSRSRRPFTDGQEWERERRRHLPRRAF
jgi:hypothetical protein